MADWVMPLFTIVVAVALLVETLAIAAMFMGILSLVRRVESVTERVQGRLYPLISQIQVHLDDLQPRIGCALTEASDLVHSARIQVERTERKITEVADELETRLVRLDLKVAAALDTVEVTGSRIRHAVLAPVRSIKALTTGIQTGISTYRERSRQSDEWADLPEERIRYRSEAEASESRRPFSS